MTQELNQNPYADRFWKKSWDEGIHDLDPKEWESVGHFAESLRPAFEQYADSIALAYLGKEITYAELDEYSNQFAQMLIANGFNKGDVVAINMPNIPEYVVALVGAQKAGCIVSGVSPLLSTVQIEYQLNDLGSGDKKVCLATLDAVFEGHITKIYSKVPALKLVVTTNVASFLGKIKLTLAKLLKKVPKGKVTPLPGITVLDFHGDVFKNYPTTPVNVDINNDDIAYIQYTGGTTGPPKGAMLTHKNALSDLLIVQHWLGWERGDVIACSGFPFFHIAGLFFCENLLYLAGLQILIPNPRDTDHICKEIEKYKPNSLVNVPSLFQLLLKNPKFAELDHDTVRVCISAASPFPVESQKQLENIVGKGKLLEVYGMTETSPLTTMNPYEREKKLGSIGLPLPNTDLKLVDPDTGKVVPIGDAGEICVRGPQIMEGYYNKPEETKKALDADGFMHTGDVAVMDEEGYLRIVDRTKDMIIVSGFKVFSTKIEDVLSKHPAVDLIALVGVPNPDRPGSEIVKAFVKLTPEYEAKNKEAVREEFIAFAKENCSPYEVPKIIEFSDEIPLTAVGKVDKKVLRAQANK